jgi:hypothetical protein
MRVTLVLEASQPCGTRYRFGIGCYILSGPGAGVDDCDATNAVVLNGRPSQQCKGRAKHQKPSDYLFRLSPIQTGSARSRRLATPPSECSMKPLW